MKYFITNTDELMGLGWKESLSVEREQYITTHETLRRQYLEATKRISKSIIFTHRGGPVSLWVSKFKAMLSTSYAMPEPRLHGHCLGNPSNGKL